MTEQQIQNDILLALGQRRDLRIWRVNCGASMGFGGGVIKGAPPGHPDLTGILAGGRWFGLEVKRPGQKQSEQQARFEAMVKRFGGLYAVARSVDEAQATVTAWLEAAA